MEAVNLPKFLFLYSFFLLGTQEALYILPAKQCQVQYNFYCTFKLMALSWVHTGKSVAAIDCPKPKIARV